MEISRPMIAERIEIRLLTFQRIAGSLLLSNGY